MYNIRFKGVLEINFDSKISNTKLKKLKSIRNMSVHDEQKNKIILRNEDANCKIYIEEKCIAIVLTEVDTYQLMEDRIRKWYDAVCSEIGYSEYSYCRLNCHTKLKFDYQKLRKNVTEYRKLFGFITEYVGANVGNKFTQNFKDVLSAELLISVEDGIHTSKISMDGQEFRINDVYIEYDTFSDMQSYLDFINESISRVRGSYESVVNDLRNYMGWQNGS